MAQETQTEALYQPRGVDGEGDGREVQAEGDICIPMADLCWYVAETNITSYYPNKIKRYYVG